MAKINSRAKGAAGEREFCKWLQLHLDLDFLPERNLEQVRDGGADIMCVPPFCVEVKRCQGIAKRDWWLQVHVAATEWWDKCGEVRLPIVAYRKNGQPWRFLISAKNIGLDVGFIQLEIVEFKKWAINELDKMIKIKI